MPVLPLETALYPDTLLEGPVEQNAGCVWWVLHTKPRAEKMLARQLLRRSVGFYLPLYPRTGRHKNRPLVSHLPLFPGYLFVHGTEDDRRIALETNCVVRTITVADQAQLQAELARVHLLTESGLPLVPEDRLLPGAWVEIISGPLKGLEGKIIRRDNQQRFVVEVDFLRRGASAEVDGWALRPLNRPPDWKRPSASRPTWELVTC
jgi:transcriptional antiterminator RfaH